MLVESTSRTASVEGRAAHQGPEVDGSTTLLARPPSGPVGDLVTAEVVGTDGVDLVATRARAAMERR